MNDDKRNRRRFLADVLFAGAALTGAAFLSQAADGQPAKPKPTPTPSYPNRTAGAPLPPQPSKTPKPEVRLGGKPMPPKKPTPPGGH